MKVFIKMLLGVLLAGLLNGCESFSYYSQAALGQWHIYRQRVPLQALIEDPKTEQALMQRLQLALRLRTFAANQLLLPDNGSFHHYVDLKHPYVVWNLVAAPELSLQPYRWCYPWLGCVGYRGYFKEAKARSKAREMAAEGWDVMVGGVQAYSTLGWFADPLLNTFTNGSEWRLAAVMFHELAHQKLYVTDDTAFNESFASTLEQLGVERWFTQQQQPEALDQYRQHKTRETDVIQLQLTYRDKLQALYDSEASASEKRQRKAALFKELQEEAYPTLRARWHNVSTFDGWIMGEMNNARLALVAQYHQWKPAFEQLLLQSNHNLAVFFREVETLAALPAEERHQQLQTLLPLSR